MGRLAGVLARLAELGVPVTEEQVLAEVGESPSVGRPHIADAMVKAGHVADRTEAFDRFLADGGPAHVPRYAIPVERGIDLVHAAGGVAVIAHPWGRGREHVLPPAVPGCGWPPSTDWTASRSTTRTTTRPTRTRLRALAGELGLLATGSSDYHGTGKLDHELGCNTTDPEVLTALLDRVAAPTSPDAGEGCGRGRRQPEGRRGQDHHRGQPGRGLGGERPSGAARRPRPAGLPDVLPGLRPGVDRDLDTSGAARRGEGERRRSCPPTTASTCSRPRSSWPPSSCCC